MASSSVKQRADLALVDRGLAPSRNRAQEMIEDGRVFLTSGGQRRVLTKPSALLEADDLLEVEPRENDYVSRGGLKMRGALEHLARKGLLDVRGRCVLDVGISTGGFADCLLRAGAARVVGVDVGHGQLAAPLRNDPRVALLEGVNARELSQPSRVEQILGLNNGRRFDLIVVDVSFISLTLVLPELIEYLSGTAAVLALVKPQFEVGREGLGKNGIVKDEALFAVVEEKIRDCARAIGAWSVEDYFASSIEGSDGNKEFFVFAPVVRSSP